MKQLKSRAEMETEKIKVTHPVLQYFQDYSHMWPSKIESKVNLHFLTQVRDVLSDPICVHDTHSEAKEMEISEFGAEKGLLQGQAERNGGSCSKVLNLNSGIFQERVLKSAVGVRE